MDDGTVEIDDNTVSHQFYVSVIDLSVAKEKSVLGVHIENDGVLGLVCHWVFEGSLLCSLDGVLSGSYGIVPLCGERISSVDVL